MSPLFVYAEMIDKERIPGHIAIIMDGNGRWAKSRGLPKIAGHRAGAAVVKKVIKESIELGVKVLSLYAFSTENWKRPKKEVTALMWLLEHSLRSHLAVAQKNNIRLLISGKSSGLPVSLQKRIKDVVKKTKDNSRLILNLALNYGGREEILRATREIASKVEQKKLKLSGIDQRLFSNHLSTRGLPDPELLIRTSGEQRLSNFLLWQISYSELYFTPKLWPEFKKQDLIEAILEYQKRQRRFGA